VRVRHDLTIHQMYLQLRSDLLSDRFSCSTEQAFHLAALAVRVECSDRRSIDKSSVEHYVAPSVLHGPARANVYHSLIREFDRVVELSQEHAKLQFIQVRVLVSLSLK